MPAAIIYSLIILISAFENRGGEPASLFPFTTAAESWSVPGIYINPLSVTDDRGLTLSFYGSRPYSEEELHSYTSGLKYSDGGYGAQFLWHSFGTDFYREERFTAGAGVTFLKMISAAGSLSAYMLDIDAEGERFSRIMYDGDTALGFSPAHWLYFSFVQNCAATASNGRNNGELYPERSAGILLRPYTGFSISWNYTDTAGGYINSFTAEIAPAEFLSLSGGYTPEDSRFAGSLHIIMKNITASYSISSHPYLGYTHSFGITYAYFPEIESVRYGNPGISARAGRININSASPEEIKSLPGITERSAERIILHRVKIGPLSERSLRQIGLDGDELESVRINCFGLARARREKDEKEHDTFMTKAKRKTFIPPKERIKEKFRKLIKYGLNASSAIRYSELSESAGRGDIDSILSGDRTLTDDQKDAVRRVCSE